MASGVVIAAVLFASYRASQRGEGPSLSDILHPLRIARQSGETLLIALRSPAPVLVIALVLERLLPVSPLQRDLTRGFGQDLFWYLVDFVRNVSWVSFYLALLIWIKIRLLGSFELIPAGVLPSVIAWTIAILAWDLVSYLSHVSHVLRHRVDFLCRFHAIHHSQRELNFFTQHRFHDLDVIVNQTNRTAARIGMDRAPRRTRRSTKAHSDELRENRRAWNFGERRGWLSRIHRAIRWNEVECR